MIDKRDLDYWYDRDYSSCLMREDNDMMLINAWFYDWLFVRAARLWSKCIGGTDLLIDAVNYMPLSVPIPYTLTSAGQVVEVPNHVLRRLFDGPKGSIMWKAPWKGSFTSEMRDGILVRQRKNLPIPQDTFYVLDEIWDDALDKGYIDSSGNVTSKFKEEFNVSFTRISKFD